MMYVDQKLTCRECGKEFTFTDSEQEAFIQKGYTNLPGRCGECRATRRAQRGNQPGDGGGEHRSSYGGSSGPSRGPRELFTTVCSECGQAAQVPFQPRNDKPVYCSACFEQRRGSR